MKRLLDALGALNPRLVTGLLVLAVCLLVLEGWMLVLRKPFTDFQQTRVKYFVLASRLGQSPNPSSELGQVTDELKQLNEKLSGQLRLSNSDDEMTSALIAALDQSASQHGVTLSSVSPKEKKQVSVFEEVPFEVSATGTYLQLSQWMMNFEKTLGRNASVTEFNMKSADDGGRLTLSLNIAMYRPEKLNGAAL